MSTMVYNKQNAIKSLQLATQAFENTKSKHQKLDSDAIENIKNALEYYGHEINNLPSDIELDIHDKKISIMLSDLVYIRYFCEKAWLYGNKFNINLPVNTGCKL